MATNSDERLSPRHTLLGHISFGIRSYETSQRFYDAVLAPIGGRRVYENAKTRILGYGFVVKPNFEPFTLFETDKNIAPSGDGVHFAFNSPDRKGVRDFWEAAVKNGGSDEGKWGLRKQYGELYYAAFVRDPDGYKLEVVFQEEDEECGEDEADCKRIALQRRILHGMDTEYERRREEKIQKLREMNLQQLESELNIAEVVTGQQQRVG
ncbi:hypothetical protein K4F52_001053 [Lecanicillium sp. MT-2017a]|nr:hypothetical protein K4F52_001053 [Lecanicillium sp. MT-2017a]